MRSCGCCPARSATRTGAADETFADGLLEYPQYTRPREFRGMAVPDILLSGNHAAIAQWRLEQRKMRTQAAPAGPVAGA